MSQKEKLAIWGLAVVNPFVCWLIAYLFWYGKEPAKYTTAVNAVAAILIVAGAIITLSLLFA
jgi:hypothetical protein